MTQKALGSDVSLGWPVGDGIGSVISYLIDAAGEKVAFVFRARRTGVVDRLSFRTGAVTTSQPLRIGLETVDTASTGDPTGVQYGGSSPGVRSSVASNTLYEVTLATPANMVAGDVVAVVIQFDGAVGNLNISTVGTGDYPYFPFVDHFTTIWNKSSSRVPMFSLRYDDGTYDNVGQMPPMIFTAASFNSGSSPNERANVLILDSPVTCSGLYACIDADAALELRLYDANSLLLESRPVSSTARGATAAAYMRSFLPTPRVLPAGQYRVAVAPTSGSNLSAVEATANEWTNYALGNRMYKSTRINGQAWVDDITAKLLAGILINAVGSGGAKPRLLVQGSLLG